MAELRAPVRDCRTVPPTGRILRDVDRRRELGVVAEAADGTAAARNQGWLRKAVILVVIAAGLGGLRAPAQQPAAGADLLDHASRRSARRIASGDIPQQASNSVQLLLQGLCARPRARR